ncbi:gamma carbonic anhydrase family protein [bacterium]|jgi:carbonic anhydrase/acetyltransferase-like protein (isoleucine patch superfamily)|nr:gamma carbonic anhydrase family protein [bacterium]
MPVISYHDKTPRIADDVFIAPNAYVIGDVEIGSGSSVFFGAVVRGDINPIIIGAKTNLQEHAVLHTSRGLGPCIVEDEVTIGHGAVLHGCHVRNRALIGMQATVLDESIIDEDALVAANSLVRMKMHVPKKMMAAGVPAQVLREVNELEREFTRSGVEHYVTTAAFYKNAL